METKTLYKIDSHGRYGSFQLEIIVGATKLPSLDSEEIHAAAYTANDLIRKVVMSAVIASDPEAQEQRKRERADLTGLFPSGCFVEEIPNGYCSDYCCNHLPWFVVTTQVGRFKIGWRKRVIFIDWSETYGTKNTRELFASEDVTKDERMIHAWSLADAKRYVDAILQSTLTPA